MRNAVAQPAKNKLYSVYENIKGRINTLFFWKLVYENY